MHILSYKAKIAIAIIGLLSISICFLQEVDDISRFSLLLIFAIPGIYFTSFFFSYVSFRFLNVMNALFLFCGFLLVRFGGIQLYVLIGFALIGYSSGAFLLLVSGITNIMWFGKDGQTISGIVWSTSAIFSIVFNYMMKIYPITSIGAGFIFILFCSSMLKKYPAEYKRPLPYSYVKFNRKSFFLSLFILLTSMSIGFLYMSAKEMIHSPSNFIYISFGAVVFPLIVLFFSNKKGIFSSCMLLIFIFEISAMCLCFSRISVIWQTVGVLLFGGLMTTSLCLYPLVCFYLFGSGDIANKLSGSMIFMPLGLLIAFYFPATHDELLFLTFFTILCSFFALFSAWKQRLTLLKTP